MGAAELSGGGRHSIDAGEPMTLLRRKSGPNGPDLLPKSRGRRSFAMRTSITER